MKWFSLFYFLIVFNVGCMSDSRSTIIHPIFGRTDTPAFRINKVEMTKDTTYIYCLYAAEAGSWANVSEETYLYSHDTQKKYNIIKIIGLPFGPKKRNFAFDEQCEAVFYFPSIDDSNKFDFIESPNKTAFNIYGVDLQNSYEESYRETDIKRFSNLSSFFDSANDTLKAVQYKREENEAIKYIYGNESEQFILSLLEMSIIFDDKFI